MKGLDTNYRIAEVDTVSGKYVGEIIDYWSDGATMLTFSYDSKGRRSGDIKLTNSNGSVRLQGQYLDGHKVGVWEVYGAKQVSIDYDRKKTKSHYAIDSLEVCLNNKESFKVSPYIRKRDYPEIYPLITNSQSFHVNKNEVFTIVEEPPYFPNGSEVLGQFIGALIRYPEEALKNNIKGKVIIEFTIIEDGSTIDFNVIKGLGFGCEQEAIRVLKLLPDWVPGYQRGKPVRTKHQIPITFG